MDRTLLAEVIATILAGGIMTLIFPDGKFGNLLKMLAGFAVAVGIISIFQGFSFSLPEFSEYEPETDRSTAGVVSALAKKEAEKIVSEYAEDFEVEVSVVSVNDSFYVEKIAVYPEKCENEEEMVSELEKKFGLPSLGVSVIKKEGTE